MQRLPVVLGVVVADQAQVDAIREALGAIADHAAGTLALEVDGDGDEVVGERQLRVIGTDELAVAVAAAEVAIAEADAGDAALQAKLIEPRAGSHHHAEGLRRHLDIETTA